MPSPAELKTVGDDSCSTLEEEEEEEEEEALCKPIT
jgi:hypothetical protein